MESQAEIRRQTERRLIALGMTSKFGDALSRGRMMAALLAAGYAPGPGESDDALFRRFLDGTAHHKATPRQLAKFTPLVTKPHPRQAELDALPRPISMPWDGTGVFWRQGSVGYVGKEG